MKFIALALVLLGLGMLVQAFRMNAGFDDGSFIWQIILSTGGATISFSGIIIFALILFTGL